MTADKVVDASAIAAVIFDEPTREETVQRLRGGKLFAPVLLPFEVAGVAFEKLRNRPSEREPLLAALNRLSDINIVYTEIDLDGAVGLAEAKALSLYDSCYLWLAQELRLDLVTLDSRLGKAAAKLHTP